MQRLRKRLPAAYLRSFVDRALGLFPAGASLFLVLGESAALAAGAEPGRYRPGERDLLSVPLYFEGRAEGQLCLLLPGLSAQSAQERLSLRRILDFLAFSLNEAAEAEAARRALADETLNKYRELALLHRAVFALNKTLRLKDTTAALLAECQGASFPAEAGCVFLATPENEEFVPADCFGTGELDLGPVRGSRLFLEVAAAERGEIVNDLPADARWQGEVPGIRSLVLLPVLSPARRVGMLALACREAEQFKAAHLKHLSTLASVAGIAVSNAQNFEDIQVLMEALLQALAEAIDARDPFTAGHSERVALLTAAFARLVDSDETLFPDVTFSEDEINELYYSGILHDIGKIGIKEDVLTKDSRLPAKLLEIIRLRMELYGFASGERWGEIYDRLRAINISVAPSPADLDFVRSISDTSWEVNGRRVPLLHEDEQRCLLVLAGNLTPEERREIERHPAESQRILQHIPFRENFRNLRTIVRQHHERLDGSGYPDGARGEAILLQSRMLAIVDIYDAITQERHYKPAATRQTALRILRDEAAQGKLDGALVALFCENVEHIHRLAAFQRFQRRHGLPGTPAERRQ